jgi:hypothetical protein
MVHTVHFTPPPLPLVISYEYISRIPSVYRCVISDQYENTLPQGGVSVYYLDVHNHDHGWVHVPYKLPLNGLWHAHLAVWR